MEQVYTFQSFLWNRLYSYSLSQFIPCRVPGNIKTWSRSAPLQLSGNLVLVCLVLQYDSTISTFYLPNRLALGTTFSVAARSWITSANKMPWIIVWNCASGQYHRKNAIGKMGGIHIPSQVQLRKNWSRHFWTKQILNSQSELFCSTLNFAHNIGHDDHHEQEDWVETRV